MAEAQGMVQKTGAHLWITHVLMITGVLVIFFPIWLAFVASTVTQPEIVSPPDAHFTRKPFLGEL